MKRARARLEGAAGCSEHETKHAIRRDGHRETNPDEKGHDRKWRGKINQSGPRVKLVMGEEQRARPRPTCTGVVDHRGPGMMCPTLGYTRRERTGQDVTYVRSSASEDKKLLPHAHASHASEGSVLINVYRSAGPTGTVRCHVRSISGVDGL